MALEKLFTDRGARRFIKESIDNAKDCGKGVCENCGKESYILKAFNKHLCEDCCQKLLNLTEDYDYVFKSTPTNEDVLDNINESYVYPDFGKMLDVCHKQFGDNMEALILSYGLKVKSDWYDKLDKEGAVFFMDGDMNRGKTHFNKFMNDFDGMFEKQEEADKVKPDPDGTACNKVVVDSNRKSQNKAAAANSPFGGKFNRKQVTDDFKNRHGGKLSIGPGDTPAVNTKAADKIAPKPVQTKKPNTKSATQVAKDVAGTPQEPVKKTSTKLDVVDTPDGFEVHFGDSFLICNLESSTDKTATYKVVLNDSGMKPYTVTVDVKGKDNNLAAEKIIDDLIKFPSKAFPSFEGMNSGFEIVKYNFCKYAVHKGTFDKNNPTLKMMIEGRPVNKKEFEIAMSHDRFVNPSHLSNVITEFFEALLRDKYPVMFNGNNEVQTSVGKVIFNLDRFDLADKDPIVSIDMDGIEHLEVKCSPADISTKDKSALLTLLLDVIDKVVPNIDKSPNRMKNPKDVGFSDKRAFEVTGGSGTESYTAYASFSEEEFLDSGDIAFLFKVKDNTSGMVKPEGKNPDNEFGLAIYRKAGQPVESFVKIEGERLYKKYFSKSNMTDVMTSSAQEKMKSPSKKMALFDKIAELFVKNNAKVKELKDLEVSASIEVNKEGRVTGATIEVADPYNDFTSDSRELASLIDLEKNVPYLKFVKAGPNNYRTDNYPTVRYEVKDIEAFSNQLKLRVLEGMILEAFGITLVSESNRKTFYM